MTEKKSTDPFTAVSHAGQHPDPLFGGVSVPIYQSSTFAFKSAEQGAARFQGKEEGYIYARIGNSTTKALEDCVADLENGCGAMTTADLIRLSVGCETFEDLRQDLEQALAQAA